MLVYLFAVPLRYSVPRCAFFLTLFSGRLKRFIDELPLGSGGAAEAEAVKEAEEQVEALEESDNEKRWWEARRSRFKFSPARWPSPARW